VTTPAPGTAATAWPTAAELYEFPKDVPWPSQEAALIVRRQVAAREAAAYARGRDEAVEAVCDCYPGGVSPEAYEGPQEWCAVHGQARSTLIQHRDAARALVDKLRAERAGLLTELGKAIVEIARLQAEATAASDPTHEGPQ
jgi:hypothetical protein